MTPTVILREIAILRETVILREIRIVITVIGTNVCFLNKHATSLSEVNPTLTHASNRRKCPPP